MATEVDMMDALPRLTRRRSAWSRCQEAVARVAPTSTTTCQVCSSAIEQGEWELGLMFLHVEGFMLMEWHHVNCTTCIPGVNVAEVLAMAQGDMTPTQKDAFSAACSKLLIHDGTSDCDLASPTST